MSLDDVGTSRNLGRVLAAVGLVAATCQAAPIWFDETNQGDPFESFADLSSAYHDFIGLPTGQITFEDLSRGTVLGNQYADSDGVRFANTAGGPHGGSSGIQPEGGRIAEHITGYDGSYQDHGSNVYVKFDNNRAAEPFTILFDEPVSGFGAFVGMGVQGNVHSLDVSLFDASGSPIAQRTVASWLWESKKSKQNYETFIATMVDDRIIARVEILNLAKANFADGLLIDNVAWMRGGAGGAVPEPATVWMAVLGVVSVWARPRRGH